jgi:NAD(P)-dependent dehydrogenase (short-subunit alcohol dehydrogenase family)
MTVAIVTGAAGGLGREIVRLLHEDGAAVVAEDVDPAVAELEGDRIAVLEGDVAQADTARRAVTRSLTA